MSGSSSSSSASRNNILRDFKNLTGMPEARCTEYLEAANWDIGLAAQAYYADHDSDEAEPAAQARAGAPAPAEYTGPRTLDGRPAPESASRANTAKKAAPKKKGLATLSSISGGHANDDHLDDDVDKDDDRGRGDLFAGGEKSGLAVQDPSQEGGGAKKIISDILAKAKANASRPDATSPAGPSSSSVFRGTGNTVGGEGSESRRIPYPNAFQEGAGGPPGAMSGEPQERTLHLWQDGFSIDDGDLHRFDDPENAMDLNMIRAGRAPLHLMNVRYDQPVDVKLHQHQENYRPLPKKYKPFGGEGRRLGSPVPGEASSSTAPAAPAASASSQTISASSTSLQPGVDESQPIVTLRIQLPNGTRLPARFNTSNTVNDVYEFVQRASADTRIRSWVLATTFPNKEHTDRSLILGEMPEFRKGGTAVVKWA